MTLLDRLIGRLPAIEDAHAHCDIPCGIYDPGPALIAAVSVVRMMDIIHEVAAKTGVDEASRLNTLVRNIAAKESEAEKVKAEIRIIWGDYFKAPLVEKHPEIHDLTQKIMQAASACRQDVHRADGEKLVDLVNRFAEIFWTTKGIETMRRPCPYPPKLDVVYPVL
ncbi:superoxide dismutase, Ni [Zavarzinia compransoris]|uniref:superoxide dismutase, Ni n=1 Tax=Zavarzinia marina TaxID=2911065 RepID=UPI001F45097D|nr:superoxide dismutase, Ni [Zavarzinia marina]MCF4165839.1 superoxide dismutase, Ni [Zavarzinia marina]